MEYINPWLVLLGLVLPNVVAYVTKLHASESVKGWTLALLSGIAAVVATLVDVGLSDETDWRKVVNNLLLIFASSVIAYKGGLVKAPAKVIALKTRSTGIGKQARDPETGRFEAA